MNTFTPGEAEKYLEMNEQELYSLLVPAQVREEQAFSKDALVLRGRTIFAACLRDTRKIVCEQYRARGEALKNSLDLVVLVAAGLAVTPTMVGIPILPMAALLVKIGLSEVCRDEP